MARRRIKRNTSERAVPHVRAFLGERVRSLRQRRGFSQETLGSRASLSGKFIGEVERGEKSISIDSLYRVSVALAIPLRELVNVPAKSRRPALDRGCQRLHALLIAAGGRRRILLELDGHRVELYCDVAERENESGFEAMQRIGPKAVPMTFE